MSGTSWSYFVPYQIDVQTALGKLRQDVFDRGDYERPRDGLDFLREIGGLGFFVTADEQARQSMIIEFGLSSLNPLIKRVGIEGVQAEVASLINAPKLPSFAGLEALRCLSANGTHSILDISRISDTPAFGSIAPLPSDEIIKIFSTRTPSHEMVEEAERWGKIDTGPRWQGFYLFVYKEEAPAEIYFTGSSGD